MERERENILHLLNWSYVQNASTDGKIACAMCLAG